MPLSWNEIKHRAIAFSKEWKGETRESAERQSFWNDFFNVFGIKRRVVASFEEPVKKLSGHWGSIDLLWPGTLLVEHKSAGEDLGKARSQAMAYIRGLQEAGKDKDCPRYLIVSDFQRIAIHDLEPEQDPDLPLLQRLPPSFEFPLADLHKHIRHFFFIAGYKQHRLNPEDPANEEATQLMCDLHDALEEEEYGTDAAGHAGHELKQFLVRLLFCLFAEDNGIFPTRAFQLYIEDHTAADGSDLGPKLGQYFDVLNTPEDRRQRNLDPDLLQFAYINGDLFAERLALPAFTGVMRGKLLACAAFDWSRISPAVFGSLFQAVMEPRQRRQIGAHYTAERNILKVVRSLFLDDLRAEFEAARKDKSGRSRGRLADLQKKIAALRFLDPACGCGNFLVITYRELRALELEILLALHAGQQQMGEAEVFNLSLIDVDQMFGIEIEEFPARIAEVALWLTDHQANVRLSEAFGQFYKRIPLRKSPHIHIANALRTDWRIVIPPVQCSYILGNPPFVGHQWRTPDQQADMATVWGESGRSGRLDYVTCWYRKAADYIQGTGIHCALVSTNSIAQGEQVGILWAPLFERGMKIDFAHRSFPWESEARGKAHVHCVIIGFSLIGKSPRRIYDYDADPHGINATTDEPSNISPYLVAGPNLTLPSRTAPREGFPQMIKGSQPTDGGNLLLTGKEKATLLAEEPDAAKWLRPFVGGEELINGGDRWCLWLKDASPTEIRSHPRIMERIAKVRESRLQSPTASVRDYAQRPTLFTQDRQPKSYFMALSEVSSETRRYIPIAFFAPIIVPANTVQVIVGGTHYHFGILTSQIHMAWVRIVAGRLESRFRYTPSVYNNFPWPEAHTPAQRSAVEKAAQRVLDTRATFPASTLADLYDPLAMPPALATAHAALDKAVDKCYRSDPFPSDRARVEHLFALYEKLTAPLAPTPKSSRRRKPL
jgi:hypothetical protein